MRDSGAFQTRRAMSWEGAGRRRRSKHHATTTAASQRNITAMKRGNHQAGTRKINPASSAITKRGANANGTRRAALGCADCVAGTRGLVSIGSSRHFDGGQNLLDHLIGGESFEIGLRPEQQAMAKHRQ